MRRILKGVAVSLIFAVAVPPAGLMALPQSRNVKRSIARLKPGYFVAVMLESENVYTGRLISVSDKWIVLDKHGQPGSNSISLTYVKDVVRAFPDGDDLTLDPADLGALRRGEKVKVQMRDGTRIEAKIISAGDEQILMKVTGCEPKGRMSGSVVIRNTDVSEVVKKRDLRGTAASALGAAETAAIAFAPLIIAIPAVILIDRHAKKTVTIHVAPRRAEQEASDGLNDR